MRLNVAIEAVLGSERAEAVQLVDGQRLPCDLLVVDIGMQPNVELARAAGLEVGQGIRVDARLQTSAPDIFAAGDVCEFRLHAQGPYQRQETWRNAEHQGHHAALNLLGAELPFDSVPGFWSDHYDWGLQTCGQISSAAPSALRVTAVTVVTVILGYPAAVIPTGEHPVNAKCRREIYSPFSVV